MAGGTLIDVLRAVGNHGDHTRYAQRSMRDASEDVVAADCKIVVI